jgi:hypothetical protein
MLSDYDRKMFNDLVDELEADDPEFVACFRARKPPPDHPRQSRFPHSWVAAIVIAVALVILLVPIGHLGGAILPALAVTGCAWYLHKLGPHRK